MNSYVAPPGVDTVHCTAFAKTPLGRRAVKVYWPTRLEQGTSAAVVATAHPSSCFQFGAASGVAHGGGGVGGNATTLRCREMVCLEAWPGVSVYECIVSASYPSANARTLNEDSAQDVF